MALAVAILYLLAVLLLIGAALRVLAPPPVSLSLALLGAACALLAYSLPAMAAGFG